MFDQCGELRDREDEHKVEEKPQGGHPELGLFTRHVQRLPPNDLVGSGSVMKWAV